MKAEELRFGNWVLFNGCPVQIRELQYMSKLDVYLDSNVNISIYNPIPLTEEVLLRCGFEYSCYGGLFLKSVWEENDITLRISIRKGIIKSFLCEHEIYIKHIHELQNLYYSLTKKELDVKL